MMKILRLCALLMPAIFQSGLSCSAAQDFSGQDLKNKNYKDEALNGAKFDNAKVNSANFTNATLKKASFRGADASSANFSQANLDGADFTGAKLKGATFTNAHAWHAKFSGTEIHLAGATTPDFSMISDANGSRSLLMANVEKTSGTLTFHYADLRNTLILGNAEGVDFRGADLCGADLSKTENLDKARLKGVKYNKNTQWKINPEKIEAVLVEDAPQGEVGGAIESPFSGKWLILKGEEGALDNGVLHITSKRTFEWDPALSADKPKILSGTWTQSGEQIELSGGELNQTWTVSRVTRKGKTELHLKSAKGAKRIAVPE